MESGRINELFQKLIAEMRQGWARSDLQIYRQILDCIPAAIFLVDASVNVVDMNAAAIKLVGGEGHSIDKRLCGDALNCVHAREDEKGCGYAAACPCDIRIAVQRASKGESVLRQRTRVQMVQYGVPAERCFWLSAVPFEFRGCGFAVLTLEEITELVRPQTEGG